MLIFYPIILYYNILANLLKVIFQKNGYKFILIPLFRAVHLYKIRMEGPNRNKAESLM